MKANESFGGQVFKISIWTEGKIEILSLNPQPQQPK